MPTEQLMTHPLTDELCDQISSSTPPLPRDHQDRVLSYDGRILDGMFAEFFEEQKHQMRAAYDLGHKAGVKLVKDDDASYAEYGSIPLTSITRY